MQKPINFDQAATTACDPVVLEAMLPFFGEAYGNPSGTHQLARKAASALTRARRGLAERLGVEAKELIFTASGSESNNLALRGVALALLRQGRGHHLISSRLEHPSVVKTLLDLQQHYGFEVDFAQPDASGQISIDQIIALRRPETILVSLMRVNNETGLRQDLEAISRYCGQEGILLHCDATQAVTTELISPKAWGVDLLTLTSHKFHGPKGVGLLWKREGVPLAPLTTGGSQEQARRAGTENLPGIIGFYTAFEQAQAQVDAAAENFTKLRQHLLSSLQERQLPIQWLGLGKATAPHITTLLLPGHKADDLLLQLDLAGIAASSGSACSSGNAEPSAVLLALGIEPALALSALRISFGRHQTLPEVDIFVETLAKILGRTA